MEEPGEEQAGAEGAEYAGGEYAEGNVQYDEAGNPYYPDAAYAEPAAEGAEIAPGAGGGGGGPAETQGHGRRKVEIEYIDDKIRRHITFSKRKAGISRRPTSSVDSRARRYCC